MRYNVAQQLVLLAEALGPDMAQRELLSAFVSLLKDSEAEVRVAAASRVAQFSRLVSVDQVLSLLGQLLSSTLFCTLDDSRA